MAGYPALADGLSLHERADGGFVFREIREERRGTAFVSSDQLQVDGYLLSYLSRCDGTRTTEDLVDDFAQEYGPLFGPMLAQQALSSAIDCRFVDVRPSAGRTQVALTGSSRGFHPVHASFEIIETCNFTCDHCYYSSSPFKKGRIELEDAIRVLSTMRRRGVRVVELTGGECTIHPDFPKILTFAAQEFEMVAIISNGYLLGSRPALRELVASFPNVIVQISIDGPREFHDRWRKHAKAFDHAVEAIRGLRALGVPVRMASAITDDSLPFVADLFRLAKALDVTAFAVAPVANLGRGCGVSDPGAGASRLVHGIQAALAPFADEPILRYTAAPLDVGVHEQALNCGAGSRTFAVDYNGSVRACNYSRDSKKFGNLLTEDYAAIFEQEATHLFSRAPAPGGPECRGCTYFHNCQGCFVKAFMTSEQLYPECPWRRKWFGDMGLGLDDDRGAGRAAAGTPGVSGPTSGGLATAPNGRPFLTVLAVSGAAGTTSSSSGGCHC